MTLRDTSMDKNPAVQTERPVINRAYMKKASSLNVRSSNQDLSSVNSMLAQYATLAYMLPWEVLDYVEILASFNPDYSQAVDNIRTLANSGHTLYVDANSETKATRVKALLEEKARTIQEQHGGIDGLIDKLLDQAATYGAMCGEWILNEELTDVVDFADINPKSIRYFWDEKQYKYRPFQKVGGKQAKEAEARGQEVKGGDCIALNENTFRYYAFDAAPSSPYGVPPFVSALFNISIQRDMMDNMSQIVKKLGLLAILDVSVEMLPPLPGETDEAYSTRASAYLDQYAEVVQQMAKDGGMVHFDDAQASTYSLTGNAAGATNIFKQNEEQIFSGLKSMPSVQGRSYSTTETYAGVAYEIIIRNTYKYQKAAKRMIEAGYWLAASLQGEDPSSISISFNKNKTLQRLEEAEAAQVEIANAREKWLLGLIDQTDVAQELGYSSPKRHMEEPPPEWHPGNEEDGKEEENDDNKEESEE